MNLRKYFKIWIKTSLLSLQGQIMSKGASFIYISGKLIRFFLFVVLLTVIVGDKKEMAGYSLEQMINFFLVFNLLDVLGQIFFRGIYWFRYKVVSGQLDLSLLKPVNILFQVLTDSTDLLDLPLLVIVIVMLAKQGLFNNWVNAAFFLTLLIAGFFIITAIHILTACIGIMTTEVDHTIWMYRDLSLLLRVPVDIYAGWLRVLLTFIVPVGIIYTFPAKALMGLLAWPWLFYVLFMAGVFFVGSIKLWDKALKHYSSASS